MFKYVNQKQEQEISMTLCSFEGTTQTVFRDIKGIQYRMSVIAYKVQIAGQLRILQEEFSIKP